MCEIHKHGARTREWLAAGLRHDGFGNAHARYAGHTEARAGFSFVRHAPPFSMVLVGEEGEGLVSLGERWVPCPPGHAYITSPLFPHGYHIRPGARWKLHWVIYWQEGVLPGIKPGDPPRLVPVEALGLRHAIEGLCFENSGKADKAATALWAALVDREAIQIISAGGTDSRLDRLWTLVRADLGAKWTLPRLAKLAGMSQENLRKLCQRHLKSSPMAQVTRFRMQQAADLLGMGHEKLASMASRLGYADPLSFSAAFKRTLGKSPREYRRQG